MEVSPNQTQSGDDLSVGALFGVLATSLRELAVGASNLRVPHDTFEFVAELLHNTPANGFKMLLLFSKEADGTAGASDDVAPKAVSASGLDSESEPFLAGLIELLKGRLELLSSNDNSLIGVIGAMLAIVKNHRGARRALKRRLLPPRISKDDFVEAPELGDSLKARLIQNLTKGNQATKELLGNFFMALCNGNVHRLIKHIGYGNAAGFLYSVGIFNPTDIQDGDNDSDTDSGNEDIDYNPITGKEWDKEPKKKPFEDMCEDEKEHKAHELLQLIHKLNKTGVMKMDLPEPGDVDN